ncbi:hypothetical protein DSO57_1000910 [Entomophthora muscae]|uniref:Uncharacterized protein n=1 Tax=Entomophthora muscae TaxID=34485 RepID=A0ACC2TKG2_9FUNG|nr:hypothetical protein DSO57_1000910 [Entomophthora muscae]
MQTSATMKQIHTATMQKPATTKRPPSVNMQAPATTKKTSTATVRAPATTKQIHAATMRKPVTTKLLPAVNVQAPTATTQAPAATTQKPVTTKLLPTVNVQAPAATKQMSAAAKQIHTATIKKPATTKLLPATNTQTLAAIKQMPTATAQMPTTLASPTWKPSSNQAPMGQPATCQPFPSHASSKSQSTPLGNSQIRKSGKAISSKPNLGGTAAQFGSLPNGEWTDRLSVRIDNSSSLENWAWEQESNPKPGFLWAARPVDCRTAHPRFSRIEPHKLIPSVLTHAV